MTPHRIRLKGPWEYEWRPALQNRAPQPAELDFPPKGRVQMPADWSDLFGDVGGRSAFRRHFQKPTNLDPEEKVWIVCDGVGGKGRALLNDRDLGSIAAQQSTARFEITPLLQPRNEIVVELEFDPQAEAGQRGGLWGAVVIEIAGK